MAPATAIPTRGGGAEAMQPAPVTPKPCEVPPGRAISKPASQPQTTTSCAVRGYGAGPQAPATPRGAEPIAPAPATPKPCAPSRYFTFCDRAPKPTEPQPGRPCSSQKLREPLAIIAKKQPCNVTGRFTFKQRRSPSQTAAQTVVDLFAAALFVGDRRGRTSALGPGAPW